MTNREIYKQAFIGVHYPGAIDLGAKSKTHYIPARSILIAAVLVVALISTAFAADFAGIASYFRVLLQGKPADVHVLEYDPGEFLVTMPDGSQISFSGINEQLTVDEVLENLQVSVDSIDGRVYFSCYEKQTDITEQFDEAGRCFLTAEINGEIQYITVFSYQGRYIYVSNDSEFVTTLPWAE